MRRQRHGFVVCEVIVKYFTKPLRISKRLLFSKLFWGEQQPFGDHSIPRGCNFFASIRRGEAVSTVILDVEAPAKATGRHYSRRERAGLRAAEWLWALGGNQQAITPACRILGIHGMG